MSFFELLKYSLGTIQQVPTISSESEWEELHDIAKKQALNGFVYWGITKLPEGVKPPKKLLLKWYMETERIRKMNEKLNAIAVKVTNVFEKGGIENCILKGQGNAILYGDPYVRKPGDIDIWINPSKAIIDHGQLVVGRKRIKIVKESYRHLEAGLVNGVALEVHLRPSFMNNLIYNYRLQKWFEEQTRLQFDHFIELPGGEGKINIPTLAFNLVYQLCHITNHFFYEGIGLRQFIDYFYLLKGIDRVDKQQIVNLFRRFGLYQMAGAVMYVERELLGLEERFLLVPVDSKRGEFLVEEIMQSGNFGKYDTRVKDFNRKTGLGRNIERLHRDFRLMRLFPSECLWEPVFRLYHYFWRLMK